MENSSRDKKEETCRKKPGESCKLRELEEVALHCSKLPKVDLRLDDDIMGYDSSGMPE